MSEEQKCKKSIYNGMSSPFSPTFKEYAYRLKGDPGSNLTFMWTHIMKEAGSGSDPKSSV